jgi:hypothetical protein
MIPAISWFALAGNHDYIYIIKPTATCLLLIIKTRIAGNLTTTSPFVCHQLPIAGHELFFKPKSFILKILIYEQNIQ